MFLRVGDEEMLFSTPPTRI